MEIIDLFYKKLYHIRVPSQIVGSSDSPTPNNGEEAMTVIDTAASPTYIVSDEAIQLNVINAREGQTDSVVNLWWCTKPNLEMELVERQVIDPMLLLVATHGDKETGRWLVPLAAEKTQIAFRHPGKNIVHAVVVWGAGDRKSLRYILTGKDNGHYRTKVIQASDPVLAELKNKLGSTSQELEDAQSDITLMERLRDGQDIEGPEETSDLTGDELQIALLELQITDAQDEIDRLSGDYHEPGEFDPDKLTQLEAKTATLQIEYDEIKAKLDERRDNPEHVVKLVGVLGEDQHPFSDTHYNVNQSKSTGELDVMIPEGMFAKNAFKWMQWLGTRYDWPRPAMDQCQLRRRALFTGATYWPRMLVVGLATLVALIFQAVLVAGLTLLGFRDVNLDAIWHPLTTSPRELIPSRYDRSNRWIHRITETGGREPRAPVFYVLNPAVFTISVVTGAICWQLFDNITFLYIGLGLMFGLVIIGVIGGTVIATAVVTLGNAWRSWEQTAHQRALRKTKSELDMLACRATPKNIEGLPRKRRVAYVAHNVKAKVCKPFAG